MSTSTLCPVCGYDLEFPAWDGESASDEICPSCGIQFGYNDDRADLREHIYSQWREAWIANGRRAFQGDAWREVSVSILRSGRLGMSGLLRWLLSNQSRECDRKVRRWYRKKGPICYEIILWDRADTIPLELLSTGLTWHWSSLLNQSPEDSEGLSIFSRKRDSTLLTPETAELLRNDFKQGDVDGCGRYIDLIATDPDESTRTSTKLELDFERFLASEGPPIRCVMIQYGDCPGAHVFVPHCPVQSVEALLTLWGVSSSSIKETRSYWGLNSAKLESIWRSFLQDPGLPQS